MTALLAACSGGGGSGGGTTALPPQAPKTGAATGTSTAVLAPLVPSTTPKSLYVLNDPNSGSSVEVFPLDANGGEAPLRTLTGFSKASGIAVAVDGTLAVWLHDMSDRVLFFAPGASGAATPLRTLNLPQGVEGIAFDAYGRLYAAVGNTIVVYAPEAAGDATAVATFGLSSSSATPRGAGGVVVDSNGLITVAVLNTYYPLTDQTSLQHFSALAANGGGARYINDNGGGIGAPLALSTNGNEYAFATGFTTIKSGGIDQFVTFQPGVSVAQLGPTMNSGYVISYDPNANPAQTNRTTLTAPDGVALDTDGTLFVSDSGSGCSPFGHIAVFAQQPFVTDGPRALNLAPIRTIYGGSSGIANPVAVALGPG